MNHSFYRQLEKPWPNKVLKDGVIIGHTTPTTAKIWLRTRQKGDYRLVLVPVPYEEEKLDLSLSEFLREEKPGWTAFKKQFPDCIDKDVKTVRSKDFTAVLEFKKLQPGTRYRYFLAALEEEDVFRVVVNNLPYCSSRRAEIRTKLSANFYFQTLPAEDSSTFSFGLFSCHNPYVQSKDENKAVSVVGMEAWNSFALNLHQHRSPIAPGSPNDLAFIIGGGDQCYVDGRDAINIWNYLYKVMEVKGDEVYPSKEDMVSWYRNIYRAYWGFPQVRAVFGMYPTYMIWDDHEICDGWGSFADQDHKIYKKAKKKGMNHKQAKELLDRMFEAAKQVYYEYQHAHNPDTPKGQFHYDFSYSKAKFYVLDGRGCRDVNRASCKILGRKQLRDFQQWIAKTNKGELVFIVSAVPMLHTRSWMVSLGGSFSNPYEDDLKDSWEHSIHDQERQEFLRALWDATKKGVRVCVLSGDVHASALFEIEKDGKKIYQITSSAITYHLHRHLKKALKIVVTSSGNTDFGAEYNRLAYFNRSSYAMVRVHNKTGKVNVSFYDATDKIEGEDGVAQSILTSLGSHTLWG